MAAYSLGLYEKAMPTGLSWEKMLECTAASGFDTLEISVDESDYRLSRLQWDAQQRRNLRQLSATVGVPIKTMCLSGHRKYPFGSHDPEIRKRSLQIMEEAVNLATDIGVRIIQLAGYDVYYEESDADTVAWFGENLNKGVEYAAKHGVILGFETMETAFMDTVTKSMHWVDRVNSPYLGVYPDIGNLKNASVLYGTDLLEDIRRGSGHIFAAHLKETRPGIYRDMDFGTGHTEYEACIKLLWELGVRHFTGEFWFQQGRDYQQETAAASRFLRAKIESAICKE
mgnify:FL=1